MKAGYGYNKGTKHYRRVLMTAMFVTTQPALGSHRTHWLEWTTRPSDITFPNRYCFASLL